jgi:hypothetical protein
MGNASAYYGGPGGRPPWARSGLEGITTIDKNFKKSQPYRVGSLHLDPLVLSICTYLHGHQSGNKIIKVRIPSTKTDKDKNNFTCAKWSPYPTDALGMTACCCFHC